MQQPKCPVCETDMVTVLGNDPRVIKGLFGPDEKWQIIVDERNSKIEAYIEDGNVPWFAIHDSKGVIKQRVNSMYVEVVTY